MPLSELLTEKDFFTREFPAPANHYRPLALLAPTPGEEPAAAASMVRSLAQRGYGGIVLDPRHFGTEFLGEAWFALVDRYLEAARLSGLFLWVLDGFTLGEALATILDEAVPGWRGWELRSFTLRLQGPDRLSLALTDPEARILGVLARPLEGGGSPVDLRPYLAGGVLEWAPPTGNWEIVYFRAVRSRGPAAESFAWTDGKAVAAWLEMGFEVYRRLFGAHFGRNFQGFFVFCPPRPGDPRRGARPLYAGDPTWEELIALAAGENLPSAETAEAISRQYLLPLREWCWQHRLRLAGYRLGGEVFPALLQSLDIGGLPDLAPATPPDPEELAGLAGLARAFRQERIASLLPLCGEALRDRATLTSLAVAGADLFLVRPLSGLPPGWERAFNDYAARLSMAVVAGGPVKEEVFSLPAGPEGIREAGRRVLAFAARGIEAGCRLPEKKEENEAAARSEEADPISPVLPPFLGLRIRSIEDWRVYIFFNPTPEAWRGVVVLPRPGRLEIWRPATGERRPAPLLGKGEEAGLPLTLEAGEAVLAIVRRFGPPGPPPRPPLLRARLRLPRGWEFVAVGGNIKPLLWERVATARWQTTVVLLSPPGEVFLADLPEGKGLAVLVNGEPVREADLGARLRPGVNRLELVGSEDPPRAHLCGRFACRGEAIAALPPVVAGPWTQNGFPYFPGPGLYRQRVEIPDELIRTGLSVWLEVGGLAEYAVARMNGEEKGLLAWPPYRLYLGLATGLRPGPNLIELEVHAPAGRPRWAFRGLLGEVSLLFVEEP
ncbi:MAG: hypothetical protein ACUVRM_02405 [Bacillota bacterium]